MKFGRPILLCVCSLLLVTAGCESAGKKSNQDGLAAYHAGNYEKAIGLFSQAITQDKDRAEYYINLGMAQCEIGLYEDAKDNFETAISYHSRSVNAYRGIGIACIEQELYGDAVEAFNQALSNLRYKKSDKAYDILAYRAEAYAGLGNYDGAIADYETLIEGKYEIETMYIYLGNMYLMKKDTVLALQSYQQSINLNHRDFEKYLNMIVALKEQDFNEESKIVQDAALSIPVKSAEECYYRGLIYLEQEQEREAFAEFEQSYNMGYEDAGYCLGYCYELRGEYKEAELNYQKQILDGSGNPARLYNQLAACKIRQGNYKEALILIERGLALGDQSMTADLLWNQAMCYEGRRDYDTAIDILMQYQQLFPEDKECKLELAYLRSR